MEMNWISVEDRLPEKPMRCLVIERGGLSISYYNQGFYIGNDVVTHWMPAPEIPKHLVNQYYDYIN